MPSADGIRWDELPEYVVVPAYPLDGDVRLELSRDDSGQLAAMAFTTVEKLVERLGRFQPWMVLRSDGLRRLLVAARVAAVVLDPAIRDGCRKWSDQAVSTLVEVNDGGL